MAYLSYLRRLKFNAQLHGLSANPEYPNDRYFNGINGLKDQTYSSSDLSHQPETSFSTISHL